jgi:hypothetical protein
MAQGICKGAGRTTFLNGWIYDLSHTKASNEASAVNASITFRFRGRDSCFGGALITHYW